MTIRGTLNLYGKTATGLVVAPEIVEALGGGKRPKVRMTIDGHTSRNSIAMMGGEYLLGVNSEVRAATGVKAGDILVVEVELDTEPREVSLPSDFAEALDKIPGVRQTFDRLSYSHQRQHVLAIEGAKAPETRSRRIAKAIDMLRAG